MDDKTLSDFMPKTNSEGEIVIGEFSHQSSIKLTTDEVIKKLSTIKDPELGINCLLYTSPSPRDATLSRMPSSA